jgi:nucleotidyltransferase/DNA polymerase involved in DNA repair
MRKIVYIFLAADLLDTELLDACSGHSSMLEPLSARELLLDLSPFKRIGDILDGLAGIVAEQVPGPASIGIATSPLLAILGGQHPHLAAAPQSSYRRLKKQALDIIQVLPGQEALFISRLALDDFSPLAPREVKLLKRLGYSQVRELADLGRARLQQLLKRETTSLWQNICGQDYRPVKGLYPPQNLGYALTLAEGGADHTQMQLILQAAAQTLGELLQQRHAACRQVHLQLHFIEGSSQSQERRLSGPCQDVSRLALILIGLLPEVIAGPVSQVRVVLEELQAVEMRSPDLFTLRYTYQEEAKKRQRTASMEQLLQRFPGRIGLGMASERREKILVFWDPWRFSSEGG